LASKISPSDQDAGKQGMLFAEPISFLDFFLQIKDILPCKSNCQEKGWVSWYNLSTKYNFMDALPLFRQFTDGTPERQLKM